MKQRISPATVTIGMIAIVSGLVAAYVARRYFEPVAPPDNRVAVVVPRYNLPKFSRVRETDVEVVRLDPSEVPEGAVRAPERVLFRTARETILAGSVIREHDLYPVGQTPTLAEQLPPGMVAVTIAVDRVNALGGLLIPESTVDVSLTLESTDPRIAGTTTKTILRGVRVLATSEQRFRTEERDTDSFRHVTVAVTPEQANRLMLAQQFGTLSIALRSQLQEGAEYQPVDDFVDLDRLLGLGPLPSEEVPQPAEIWRGTQMTEVEFGGNRGASSTLAAGARPASAPPAATGFVNRTPSRRIERISDGI